MSNETKAAYTATAAALAAAVTAVVAAMTGTGADIDQLETDIAALNARVDALETPPSCSAADPIVVTCYGGTVDEQFNQALNDAGVDKEVFVPAGIYELNDPLNATNKKLRGVKHALPGQGSVIRGTVTAGPPGLHLSDIEVDRVEVTQGHYTRLENVHLPKGARFDRCHVLRLRDIHMRGTLELWDANSAGITGLWIEQTVGHGIHLITNANSGNSVSIGQFAIDNSGGHAVAIEGKGKTHASIHLWDGTIENPGNDGINANNAARLTATNVRIITDAVNVHQAIKLQDCRGCTFWANNLHSTKGAGSLENDIVADGDMRYFRMWANSQYGGDPTHPADWLTTARINGQEYSQDCEQLTLDSRCQ